MEKVFYGKVETDFDFDKFSTLLDKYIDEAKTTADLFDAKHRAYFTAWDNGKHFLNKKYIVMHDSAGLYLTNIDKYFEGINKWFMCLLHPLEAIIFALFFLPYVLYRYIVTEPTYFDKSSLSNDNQTFHRKNSQHGDHGN